MVRYCRRFNVFEAFSCKIRDPHVFSHSGIKVAESLHLDLKISFSLQYCKSLSIVCLSPLFLNPMEAYLNMVKRKLIPLKLRSFQINNLFKTFLIH